MSIAEEIEWLKQQLYKLISLDKLKLNEGEILRLSRELDKLIVNYHEYEENL